MKSVYVSPVKAILHCLDDPALDFILCTSEGSVPEPVPSNALLLEFLDVTEEGDPRGFNAALATEVAAFLHRPEARAELFVCCDCAVSRSPALAAAILRHLGGDELSIWRDPYHLPNPLVYRLQCEAFGLPVTKEIVTQRPEENRKARRNYLP